MKFEINSMTYDLTENSLSEIQKQHSKDKETKTASFIFGLTDYIEHKIMLNKDLCEEEKVNTLKHELAHCWLHCYAHDFTTFTEEIVCDVIASSNDFINSIVNKYKGAIK